MKRVNWDAIPSQCILGKRNVWTSERTRKTELVLDIRSMEELFHAEGRALQRGVGWRASASGGPHSKGRNGSTFSKAAQVTILDSKKSMNIAIFLKTFKRPVAEMVEDILQGNWLRFGTGKLKDLCKLLPDNSEVKKLSAFNGEVSLLPEADQFMVQLVKVPGYEERLKTMVLREEFFPLMEEMKNSVDVMNKAANELLSCDNLHSMIRLVLKAGNYMNAGGRSGNTIGFRMNSLLRLAETKANKPAMNLMHYVAKQAEDIDAELLTFPSQLEHIKMASRICQDEVKADFQRQMKEIEEVQLYASRHPGLIQQMETFLLRAKMKLSDLGSSLHELDILSHAVAEYFCEEPTIFKLEDCCSVFHSFCQKFLTAIQENRNREAVELRRKHKDHLIKRRSSLSGQEPQPPGKHDASSERLDTSSGDHETSNLELALHSLLSATPKNRSRRSVPLVEEVPVMELSILTKPPPPPVAALEKPDVSLERNRRLSPEKKQGKLNEAEDEALVAGNQEEAVKMREVTRKLICYQNCQGKGAGADCPHHLQSTPVNIDVPGTPRPTTRDYYLSSNGPSSSPWTILSPFSCPERNADPRTRRVPHVRRSFSISNGEGDDFDDGTWQMSPTLSFCSPTLTPSSSSPSYALEDPAESRGERVDFQSCSPSKSHFECLAQRPFSLGPLLRSYSLDETQSSSTSGSWLGELIQRSINQRTKSCSASRTNSPTRFPTKDGSGSGLISFFRRIGNKNKTPDSRVNYLEMDT